MHDVKKTKEQLIHELAALRQRCAALETALALSSSPNYAGPQDHAWYRHVVEHGQGLICVHDLDGVLLFVNPAAARALGYEPHEGIGKKLSLFLAPSTRHLFGAYLERIRSQPTDSDLMRVITKHGEERVWAYHNVRYEEPGHPPHGLGHAQDLTDHIQLEQKLQAELQRAQERFVKAFHASPDAIILSNTA